MADRFVQQHPRPAGAQHHLHFTGRGRDRGHINGGLAQGLVRLGLPVFGFEQAGVPMAPTGPGDPGLHPAVLFQDNTDVQPDQWADIAGRGAAGAHDMNQVPGTSQRSADLAHPLILCSKVSINFLKQLDLGLELIILQRVVGGIQMTVGLARGNIHPAALSALDCGNRSSRPFDRFLGQFVRVSVAGHFPHNPPQTKPLRGIKSGGFQMTVIE